MEELLERFSRRQWDEWVAFLRTEEQERDRVREILLRGFYGLLVAWGAKVEPGDLDPQWQPPANMAGPGQAAAILKQHCMPTGH
ncbi:MAG: hypothetical protein ACOY3P_07035 [Planctomycetota bacterium]